MPVSENGSLMGSRHILIGRCFRILCFSKVAGKSTEFDMMPVPIGNILTTYIAPYAQNRGRYADRSNYSDDRY